MQKPPKVQDPLTYEYSAARALMEHDQLLEKVFASLAEVVLVQDPVTRVILQCSAAAGRVLGYLPEELVGKTTECLYPTPEIYEDLGRMIRSALDQDRVLHTEGRMRRKDGGEIIVDLSITEIRDERGERIAIVGSIHDVTQHKLAMMALAESEEKFRTKDRKRAELDLQRRMVELEALHAVAQAGTESANLDEFVGRVFHILEDRLYTGAIGIGFYDPKAQLLTFHPAARNFTDNMSASIIDVGQGITGWVARHRAPRLVGDVCGEPDYLASNPGSRSELCVPITVGDSLIGVINVESPRLYNFSEADEQLLVAVAGEMGTAVEKIRLLEAERDRRKELEVLAELSAAVRVSESREVILPLILERIANILTAQAAAISFRDPKDEALVFEQGWGDWEAVRGIRVPRGSGISGYVAGTKGVFVSEDARNDPRLFRKDFAGSVDCLLCLPLLVEEETAAVLYIGRGVPFQSAEVRLVQAMGDILASAIHRVQLHRQTLQQLERLTALRAIDQIILSGLDLEDTLEVLLEKITSLLQVDAAEIMLYDPCTRLLRLSAARGLPQTLPMAMRLRLEDSFVGKVILTREMDFIPDIHRYHDDLPEYILDLLRPFTSYLAVPLAAKGEIKGVLHLFNQTRLEPAPDWVDFMQALADQVAIAVDNIQLFEKQQQTNRRLVEAYDNTIDGWSRALDLRDNPTEGHSRRVTELTLRLAERLGFPPDKLAHIRRGAQLHDIGKMGIPDEILRKPGSLTDEEWEIMRKHPFYALDFLYPIEFLQPALEIPSCHHEKWDGSGYPQGLEGEEIPLSARIFAVVDVWDALTSDRPYRKAWTSDEALEYIRKQAGKHFDPQVVHEFVKICGN